MASSVREYNLSLYQRTNALYTVLRIYFRGVRMEFVKLRRRARSLLRNRKTNRWPVSNRAYRIRILNIRSFSSNIETCARKISIFANV